MSRNGKKKGSCSTRKKAKIQKEISSGTIKQELQIEPLFPHPPDPIPSVIERESAASSVNTLPPSLEYPYNLPSTSSMTSNGDWSTPSHFPSLFLEEYTPPFQAPVPSLYPNSGMMVVDPGFAQGNHLSSVVNQSGTSVPPFALEPITTDPFSVGTIWDDIQYSQLTKGGQLYFPQPFPAYDNQFGHNPFDVEYPVEPAMFDVPFPDANIDVWRGFADDQWSNESTSESQSIKPEPQPVHLFTRPNKSTSSLADPDTLSTTSSFDYNGNISFPQYTPSFVPEDYPLLFPPSTSTTYPDAGMTAASTDPGFAQWNTMPSVVNQPSTSASLFAPAPIASGSPTKLPSFILVNYSLISRESIPTAYPNTEMITISAFNSAHLRHRNYLSQHIRIICKCETTVMRPIKLEPQAAPSFPNNEEPLKHYLASPLAYPYALSTSSFMYPSDVDSSGGSQANSPSFFSNDHSPALQGYTPTAYPNTEVNTLSASSSAIPSLTTIYSGASSSKPG